MVGLTYQAAPSNVQGSNWGGIAAAGAVAFVAFLAYKLFRTITPAGLSETAIETWDEVTERVENAAEAAYEAGETFGEGAADAVSDAATYVAESGILFNPGAVIAYELLSGGEAYSPTSEARDRLYAEGARLGYVLAYSATYADLKSLARSDGLDELLQTRPDLFEGLPERVWL